MCGVSGYPCPWRVFSLDSITAWRHSCIVPRSRLRTGRVRGHDDGASSLRVDDTRTYMFQYLYPPPGHLSSLESSEQSAWPRCTSSKKLEMESAASEVLNKKKQ
eukprot:scaffold199986_cov38-Prasinocladus_malaysianus.AAC.1